MLRKLTLALVAAASLGTMALSSTAASASPLFWPHPHHHWHSGFGFVNAGYVGCYQKRLVPTPFGYRWRTVNVCVY